MNINTAMYRNVWFSNVQESFFYSGFHALRGNRFVARCAMHLVWFG